MRDDGQEEEGSDGTPSKSSGGIDLPTSGAPKIATWCLAVTGLQVEERIEDRFSVREWEKIVSQRVLVTGQLSEETEV